VRCVVVAVEGEGELTEIGRCNRAACMPGRVANFIEENRRQRLRFENRSGRLKQRRQKSQQNDGATF
jgi:hypothetical protein